MGCPEPSAAAYILPRWGSPLGELTPFPANPIGQALCETRGEGIEALARVSSSSKKEQEVQTDSPASHVMTVQQGVDTRDLERGIAKVSVSTQTGTEKAGTEERGRPLVEAGNVDIKWER